ncbi:MAG: hypothetical protein ACI9A7_001701, partial [Cyclobacteriaceae bacterium]
LTQYQPCNNIKHLVGVFFTSTFPKHQHNQLQKNHSSSPKPYKMLYNNSPKP